MNNAPAFQFYAADYLADANVAMMSLEEEGAYIRALAYCWREGSLPADIEKLGRLLKGASNQTLTVVRDCFTISSQDDSRLIHPRLEKERQKQLEWRKKSAEAGKASGIARKTKNLQTEPKSNVSSVLVEPKSNSSSSSSTSSSKQRQVQNPSSNAPLSTHDPTSNPEQEEKIYEAYPRKVGKAAALKAIRGAVVRLCKPTLTEPAMPPEAARRFLWKKATEYANSPAGAPPGSDGEDFRPHPATWFNQARYLDAPEEWQKTRKASTHNGKPTQANTADLIERANAQAAIARANRGDPR